VKRESRIAVHIKWEPQDSGNYREIVVFNYEGFRLHVILLGCVPDPHVKVGALPDFIISLLKMCLVGSF